MKNFYKNLSLKVSLLYFLLVLVFTVAVGCRGTSNRIGDEDYIPPSSISSLAIMPFFHRADNVSVLTMMEDLTVKALRAQKKFIVKNSSEVTAVMQKQGMLSDYLRFQAEYRHKGSFEHNIIEVNAVLDVSALLFGEVVAYEAQNDKDGISFASVGLSLIILDHFTNIAWQRSQVISEKNKGAEDLQALASKVVEELVAQMPY